MNTRAGAEVRTMDLWNNTIEGGGEDDLLIIEAWRQRLVLV
jgi:hypothetical protein